MYVISFCVFKVLHWLHWLTFNSPISLMSKFWGLRSRCNMRREWQYANPRISWNKNIWKRMQALASYYEAIMVFLATCNLQDSLVVFFYFREMAFIVLGGDLAKRLLGVGVIWPKDSLVLTQPWHQGVFCPDHPNTKESFGQIIPL